jgi:hypothetical protein
VTCQVQLFFIGKRRKPDTSIIKPIAIIAVTTTEKTITHKILVFAVTFKNERFMEDIWICESGACRHYCKSSKGLFNAEDITESITLGNGKSMMRI